MKLTRFITTLFAVFLATAVKAQSRTVGLQFTRGSSGADILGRFVGSEEVHYRLGASAGKQMRVDLATSNSSFYFDIFAPDDVPDQSTAMFIGSVSGTSYLGILSENGTYTIQVFLNRNAARRNETAEYRLSVIIGGAVAPAQDIAVSLNGGLDWWVVTGVSNRLNVRSGPSTANSVVTTVPECFVISKMSCTQTSAPRCRGEDSQGRFVGWVAGRFMAELAGPAAASAQPATDFAEGLSGGPDWWSVTGVSRGDTLNVRSGPSTSNPEVARVPNGYPLRNMGCVQRSPRWCQVEAADGRFAGWVTGRFLREGAAPSTGTTAIQSPQNRPRPAAGVPEIFQRSTGELEVIWAAGCQIFYSPSGRVTAAGSTCSRDRRGLSEDAVTRYRGEQGLSTASYGAIATPLNGMQLYFLGATAGHFQTSVTGVETDSPLNLGNLYVVTGCVKNQPARAFRCQFDAQGHFTGVFQ